MGRWNRVMRVRRTKGHPSPGTGYYSALTPAFSQREREEAPEADGAGIEGRVVWCGRRALGVDAIGEVSGPRAVETDRRCFGEYDEERSGRGEPG